MLEVADRLNIGIPKEITFQENRFIWFPDDVGLLINHESCNLLFEEPAREKCKFFRTTIIRKRAHKISIANRVSRFGIILKVAPCIGKLID